MEIPTNFFILSTVFFALLSLFAIYKAVKEKIKIFAISALLTILGTLWSILFVYDQVSLAAVFWASAMIISIIYLPNLSSYQDEKMRLVNARGSIRLSDFFSNTNDAWIKIAYRNGIEVAVILYFVQIILIGVVLIYVFDYFYNIPLESISIALFTGAVFSSYRLFQQIQHIT
jgi:hypothetical protein